MCGIFGFNFRDSELLREMGKALAHRGPDDHGNFTDHRVSLGHRRLSVIDLSKKGRQPMSNEEGSIWVALNGEIYNFRELRAGLSKHRFRSETDTEVLVHLYEEQGPSFVERLDGIFAFALYDSEKAKLMLARDRAGVKQLYYHFDGYNILFASEIKALLEHKAFGLDFAALDEFFTFQFVSAPRTLFNGVRCLRPAEMVEFDLKLRKMSGRIYWKPRLEILAGPESAWVEKISKLAGEAVRKQLASDVPVGVYLSGGLDSSYVAAMAAKHCNDIRTFTAGFGHETDETKFARAVAERLGTEHVEIMIDADFNLIPKVTWHLDSPAVNIASIPLYAMAKASKKFLTVALTGDGGDEVFGGYDKYRAMLMRKRLGLLPGPVRRRVLSAKFGPMAGARLDGMTVRDEAQAYLSYASTFTPGDKKGIYGPMMKPADFTDRMRTLMEGHDTLQRVMWMDFRTQLADDYNVKVDRMTMAAGIEARVPLLDTALVEAGLQMPPRLKINGSATKVLFRKLVARDVPEIANRRKQGFTLPTEKWMAEGLEGLMVQAFEQAPQDVLNRRGIAKLIENYTKEKRYYTRQLWSVFAFIVWHKMYFGEGRPGMDIRRLI